MSRFQGGAAAPVYGVDPTTGNPVTPGAGLPTSLGQKTAANSTSVVLASDQSSIPVTLGGGASIALVTPAAALSASSDTTFTFASQAKHVLVQNNSATAVGIEFDAAATAGSFQVSAGQAILLDVPVTALHMYSTAATNVNGSTGSNIILKGWS